MPWAILTHAIYTRISLVLDVIWNDSACMPPLPETITCLLIDYLVRYIVHVYYTYFIFKKNCLLVTSVHIMNVWVPILNVWPEAIIIL